MATSRFHLLYGLVSQWDGVHTHGRVETRPTALRRWGIFDPQTEIPSLAPTSRMTVALSPEPGVRFVEGRETAGIFSLFDALLVLDLLT